MTKRITSEDCEGNIEDIEDGRYNTHVVPVSAEDDPGYEDIDYGDCTEFTVPLGRYGSHVVPIGGSGGGSGAACLNGGLKGGTNSNGEPCLSVNLKAGGALVLQNGKLAIDTTKLKITTDQVYPSGTNTGIVITGPDGESWRTQYDYNQWLYTDKERQDELIEEIIEDIDKIADPDDGSLTYRFVTHEELDADQERQDEDNEEKFVNVSGGDSMEGQLIINGPRKAGDDADNPELVSSLKVLSIDNAQNSSLQLRHSGNAKVYIGDTDLSIASDIKFNRAAGSVVKSNVQDLLNIGSEEIAYLGRSIEDEDLITKKYVDDAKDFLQNEIIELEEEIEAIAPSTERGSWAFNPVGNVSLPGAYTMYTDSRDDGLGGVASIFAAAKNITLNERDLNNTVHNFGGTDPGDLIEIFEEGDDDYGLYSIISIQKLSNPNPGGISYTYLSIDVHLERTGNGDMADGRARFKVFKAPSGGDASGFVKRTGDEMSGNLVIDKSDGSTDTEAGLKLKGSRGSTTNAAATITFDNAQAQEKGYLTYRAWDTSGYFRFNQDVDLNNNGLHSVGRLRMQPGAYIGSGSTSRIIIRNGTNSDAATEIQRAGDNKRTFAIKGKAAGTTDIEDFFWAYSNSGDVGDAINYTGKITSPSNIVNKEYVDSKAGGGGVDINCSTSNRSKGDMWYCSTDQVLYIKVS